MANIRLKAILPGEIVLLVSGSYVSGGPIQVQSSDFRFHPKLFHDKTLLSF